MTFPACGIVLIAAAALLAAPLAARAQDGATADSKAALHRLAIELRRT